MRAKIKNDFILNALSENFQEEIYLVGGSVRDFLNDTYSHDRDLVVLDVNVREFALKVAKFFDAILVELDSENEIYRVVLKDKINYLDITKPQNDSILEDLKLRDLTINSIAVNIKTGGILDVTGGLEDFKNGILRVFDETSITNDPLRLLRIFRFLAVYGFTIEPRTLRFIKKHKDLLSMPAIERKIYEIIKLFGGKFAHEAILAMDDAGILQDLFPFVAEYKKVPANTHHHLDLFHHLVETVRQIQLIYENSLPEVKAHLEKTDFGANSRLAHLKFAGFLHDLGKFSTWTIEEDGRHRFIKHDDVGAKMAEEFLKSLKFSKKQIAYICEMIKYHIYPSSVMSAPEINDKIMMRFVRKMNDNALDIITLARADRLSARGVAVSDEMVANNLSSLDKLQNFYLLKKDFINIRKLLNGEEIMKIKKISQGKQLGEIIKALKEAQVDGSVITPQDAIHFVENYQI